jgi:protocatechuate 3,4-dioxygenase beta subunit
MKQKRHLERKREVARKRDAETSFVAPSYDFISNASCILTPEVSNGPYWLPASEMIRQNVTENEVGVPLQLDIGVIDVNTCEPLEGVLLSIWHCNSTGYYSSFEAHDPNTRFGAIAAEEGIALNSTDFRSLQTSNSTWLRGMWPTDAQGGAEFQTIFPGFYIQRTIHIHVQVHTNWSLTADGRVNSSRVIETGQIFAGEALTEEIMALEPYSSHTEVARWHNDVDAIFNQASQSKWDDTVHFE